MNVEEVLKQMNEQTLSEYDNKTEEYCTLESDVTRQIIVPEKYSVIGVESDEKSNRIKFKFPQHVNDVDLSMLNLRVNYRNANGEIDQNVTENKEVLDDGYVTFDWTPTRKVTKYKGEVYFIICALKTGNDGILTNEWNTTLVKTECLEGLKPEQMSDEDKEQVSDYMLQLLSIIDLAKKDVIDASEQTQQNKTESDNLYKLTRSYAVGDTETRPGEETDNSKYYYEQCKDISESITGALKPMGTIAFENLSELSNSSPGDMYNISNEFVTDERFKEGSGNTIPLGSNVYKTTDGFWDVLTGSPVTGIKGESEQTYRRGNVNITKENIGLENVPNVTTDNQVFTFTESEEDTELISGEKASVIFGKLASIVKSVISLNSVTSITKTNNYMYLNVNIYKKGNVVTMSYTSDWNSGVPQGDLGTLFTLPKEYCPLTSIMTKTFPGANIQITIRTNGDVDGYNYGEAITSKTSGRFSITYAV